MYIGPNNTMLTCDEGEEHAGNSTKEGAVIASKDCPEDDDSEILWSDDCYSLMFTGSYGFGFSFALLVFLCQIGVMLLILLDLINMNDESNIIKLPPGVALSVNLAQFLGVILIVYFVDYNGDLMKGVSRLMGGYDTELLDSFPCATKTKWILSSVCQSLVGAVLQIDLFLLLMQSTDVIGLCLNFAALHFAADIDDVAFSFASKGVISEKLRNECDEISNLKIPAEKTRRKLCVHQSALILIVGLMFGFYAYFVALQWNGHLLCKNLYVQFGDAYLPEMAYYSGIFEAQGFRPNQNIDERPVYIDSSGTIRLAYCNEVQAWVFSKINDDYCNYFMKSSETSTFDVTELAGTDRWTSRNFDTQSDVPTDWLLIRCNDCSDDICSLGRGVCVENECICNNGFLGRYCEFPEPSCSHLNIDLRKQDFLSRTTGGEFFLAPKQTGFRTVHSFRSQGVLQFHNRPVYISAGEGITNTFSFLVFSGRRWILFGRSGHHFFDISTESMTLIEYFQSNAHNNTIRSMENAFFENSYKPYFFSAPTDFGTKSYSVDPIGLDWFTARRDKTMDLFGWHANEDQLTGAKLQCADCDPEWNPCQNGGVCNVINDVGVCECLPLFEGTLCESIITCDEVGGCLNNGTCNEYNFCACPYPYYGNMCQNYPPNFNPPFSCFRKPCLNDGICDMISGICDCPDSFHGERCEKQK